MAAVLQNQLKYFRQLSRCSEVYGVDTVSKISEVRRILRGVAAAIRQ